MTAAPAGVYVHLPFCPYICPYCDFAKWTWDDARAARYLAALRAEIAQAVQVDAATLFFGGGYTDDVRRRDDRRADRGRARTDASAARSGGDG